MNSYEKEKVTILHHIINFCTGQLSMKNKKLQFLTSLLLAFTGAQVANAEPSEGAYVADQQRFYIEGQPLTKSVGLAQAIVCYLAAMSPNTFIDGGAYVAKYYEGRCDAEGADSTSESAAATPTSAASETTASSATSGAGNTTELASLATVDVVFEATDGVVRGKTWITALAEEEFDFDETIYINTEMTEGVSIASPNGDFEVWFSTHILEDFTSFGLSAGDVLSQGYLKASGTEIIFKNASFDGEASLALSISDNGDTEGIYNRRIGVCEGCPSGDGPPPSMNPKFSSIQANYQFYIDVAEKQFCQNLQSIAAVCNGDSNDLDFCAGAEDTRVTDENDENFNGFEPLRVPLTFSQVEEFLSLDGNSGEIALDGFGELVAEECFSTDKSLATKNVYRYGVYNENGNRTTMAKEGEVNSFSMFADVTTEVEVDGVFETREERIYGHAEYHGVYLDPRGRQLIVPGVTEFKKDNFGDTTDSSISATYVVAETEVLVEKRTGEYTSLASLDKIQLGLHVNDNYWVEEFTALLGVNPTEMGYEQFSGSYDADTAEFTLYSGTTWYPDYAETLLDTPIVFTTERWLETMEKVDESWTEIRSMGVWSNDTRQWYEISAAALADPALTVPVSSTLEECPEDRWSTVQTDSCRGGVKTEKTEYIPVSALAGSKLACIENCLDPGRMQATYLAGYCATEDGRSDNATCGGLEGAEFLPTPFSTVGPFLKEDVTIDFDGTPIFFMAGMYWDGVRASNVVKYDVTADNSGFEVGGAALTKGSEVSSYLNAAPDPYYAFGEAKFATLDGRFENLSWGLGTGRLILEADLSEIECEKNEDGAYEDHPEFIGDEETELRYCMDKIHSGVGLTTYQIRINNQPSYSLLLSGTETAVAIATPKTLYYQVPDEAGYGQDGGKLLSLEFAGHGELRGVPGYVLDVDTGEDLGEFITEWQDSYRYINRFIIPDGSVVTDSDGFEYFVKALDGEEWFKKLNPLEGSGSLATYTFTPDQLAPNSILRVMGDPNDANYIGEAPTCDDPDDAATCELLNDGNPTVEHGVLAAGFEVSTDPCSLNPDLSCGADTIAVDGKIWYQPDLFIGVTYQDITDVCGSGICNGLLNGHDLTNWTWANASDLNALMAYYETISDQECAVQSLFADGWRDTNSLVAYFNLTIRINGAISGATEFFNIAPRTMSGEVCGFNASTFAEAAGFIAGVPEELLIATRMGGFFYRTP